MKSLKFEDLRGTNTAIHCPTQEEAIQVEKICNFKDRANNWKHYRENFCINLEEDGEWSSIDYYEDDGYAIIPAADFIPANNKQAPDLSHFLPPLPSEKVEAEIDIQKFAKAFNANMQIIEERLDLMTDLCNKLQGKVNILESKLSKKPDTTQPAISQTPAEPEVKLPVTIEEVTRLVDDFEKSNETFSGDLHFRTMHKKTQSKILANIQLSIIAEAQNEIEPRGAYVYVAQMANGEILHGISLNSNNGKIHFHSEQGLRDCIEANRELWMDLLKSE